jgi:hypothetical protein
MQNHLDVRFGDAKSDADASQHTYEAQPLFNTDV